MTRAFETRERKCQKIDVEALSMSKECIQLFFYSIWETFITLLVQVNKMTYINTPNVLVSL
jgi:hypothetical protein